MAPGVIWTKEECEKLNDFVKLYGKKWTLIASLIGSGKNGKQCRRQWERLNMSPRQGGWSPEEDQKLLELHSIHGNKWTFIAKVIGGRTDNAVKNRFHALRTKEKAKLLAKMDSTTLDEFADCAASRRSLKHFTSLERLRASSLTRRQMHCENAVFTGVHKMDRPFTGVHKLEHPLSEVHKMEHPLSGVHEMDHLSAPQPTVCVKNEPGVYSNLPAPPPPVSCEDWTSPVSHTSWMPQTSFFPPLMFPQYPLPALEGGFGGLTEGPCWDPAPDSLPILDHFYTNEKFSEDLDSMESSSNESKTKMHQRDCVDLGFHPHYDDINDTGVISYLSGTAALPLSSRVLRNCDFQTLCDDQEGGLKTATSFFTQNHTSKNPNLTLDVNFPFNDGLPFDSIFQKFSPASPSAFLKPLSPAVQ